MLDFGVGDIAILVFSNFGGDCGGMPEWDVDGIAFLLFSGLGGGGGMQESGVGDMAHLFASGLGDSIPFLPFSRNVLVARLGGGGTGKLGYGVAFTGVFLGIGFGGIGGEHSGLRGVSFTSTSLLVSFSSNSSAILWISFPPATDRGIALEFVVMSVCNRGQVMDLAIIGLLEEELLDSLFISLMLWFRFSVLLMCEDSSNTDFLGPSVGITNCFFGVDSVTCELFIDFIISEILEALGFSSDVAGGSGSGGFSCSTKNSGGGGGRSSIGGAAELSKDIAILICELSSGGGGGGGRAGLTISPCLEALVLVSAGDSGLLKSMLITGCLDGTEGLTTLPLMLLASCSRIASKFFLFSVVAGGVGVAAAEVGGVSIDSFVGGGKGTTGLLGIDGLGFGGSF